MGIGIIGEYIGKIYSEVKRRPRYAIEMDIFSSNESGNHQKEAVLNKGR